MRFTLPLLLAALVSGGCRSSREPRMTVGKGVANAPAAAAAQPKPSTRPVNAVRARVVSVREDLRFAIIDFTGGKRPALDQQLSVYRLDQKVAEVRVSGPFRGTTVAVDITAGDCKPGDLARDR